jgi:hypothetical protein
MAKKGKRGRESAGDMVRSLGLVLAVVLVVFFLAQPPHSDAKKLRVVDPSSDAQAFASAAPGGATPRTMPAGWRSTVSTFDPDTGILRIGWVTPKGAYAEYAAAAHGTAGFVADLTARAPRVATLDIGGRTWQEYRQDEGFSLVRDYGPTTVVLGTLRDTASLDELRVLAARLTP